MQISSTASAFPLFDEGEISNAAHCFDSKDEVLI